MIVMALWTTVAWLSYLLVQWAGGLSWNQALQNAKDLQVPVFIAPWWQQLIDALAPLLEITQGFLSGLLQFAGTALPFVVGVIWLFGMLGILALALLVSGGVWWFTRRAAASSSR